jgi:nickel-dependent lactate racemase
VDYGGGMGVFINSIASSKNTKDKWWQYWVNGEYAKVGVSNYRPSSGDVIEFKLTGETIKNSQ